MGAAQNSVTFELCRRVAAMMVIQLRNMNCRAGGSQLIVKLLEKSNELLAFTLSVSRENQHQVFD